MKRILSFLLVAVMLFSVATAFPATAEDDITYGYVLGDVNDDRLFDMKDLLEMRKFLLGILPEKDISTLGADVDKNGVLQMNDLLDIRKMMLGLKPAGSLNSDKRYQVDTISIGEKNVSRFTIVYPAGDKCMESAASNLKNYINRACGISVNRTTDEASVTGQKIKLVYDSENKFDLGKEGFRITVESNGDLLINCGSMRAPIYAVQYFLEESIGWRFLATDFSKYPENSEFHGYGNVEYLYEAENINVPTGYEVTEVPYLSYRGMSNAGVGESNVKKLYLNGVDGSYGWFISSEDYGWGVGTTLDHAHSFDDQLGCDVYYEQPCLTDEATYTGVVDYTLNYLEEHSYKQLGKHYTQVPCSPNDNNFFCMCGPCKVVYAAEGNIAGAVFRLANRVAERLEIDYPGIEVFCISYADGGQSPKLTRPRENVVVCVCIGGCNNHTYDDLTPCIENGGNPRLSREDVNTGEMVNESNKNSVNAFNMWCEATNNVYAWYYSTNFIYSLAPAPMVFNIYDDLKYCAQQGAIGVYFEGDYDLTYSFEYLKSYLGSKMMWNPFMSEEEFNSHIDEFLMIYYGDGWQYIREYLERSNHAGNLKKCWTNNFDRPFEMYDEEYFKNNYTELRKLFDKAIEATEDEEQKYRIQLCSLQCDYLGLSATYERDYVNGDATAKAEFERRYKAFYNFVKEYNIEVTAVRGEGYDDHGCQNFPKNDTPVNPMTWFFEDFTGYWGN